MSSGVAVGAAWDVDGASGPEQVVHEEDAHQVVEVVVDDREAAVPGLAHGPGDVLRVDRDGERRPRRPSGS